MNALCMCVCVCLGGRMDSEKEMAVDLLCAHT